MSVEGLLPSSNKTLPDKKIGLDSPMFSGVSIGDVDLPGMFLLVFPGKLPGVLPGVLPGMLPGELGWFPGELPPPPRGCCDSKLWVTNRAGASNHNVDLKL
jgi:hypothetical protein